MPSCKRCGGSKPKRRTYPYAYTTGKINGTSAAVYFRQAVAISYNDTNYQFNVTQVIKLDYDLIYQITSVYPESVKFVNPVEDKHYRENYLPTKTS